MAKVSKADFKFSAKEIAAISNRMGDAMDSLTDSFKSIGTYDQGYGDGYADGYEEALLELAPQKEEGDS